MQRTWWLVPAALAVLLAGCGGPAKTPNQKPTFKELSHEVLAPGKGELTLAKDDTAIMLYRGTLLDGTEFDSNTNGGMPFAFRVGGGTVIKAWDEGFIGMKAGEKRKLMVPSAMGYGPAGSGKIPPNADLTFEVELLGIVKNGEDDLYDAKDLKTGTGPEAKAGDTVEIHYVGKYLNGKEFDNSRTRGKTASFKVGSSGPGAAIPGIDDGVRGMRVGGKRTLRVPPALMFGAGGSPNIQGNQMADFEVDLISVNGRKS
jgi:FKBP-type peptidyl-prolyl cis-trans isomerase